MAAGGFAHYRAANAGRIAMMKGEIPNCQRYKCQRVSVGPSMILCSLMRGPTGSAKPSPNWISQCLQVSGTFRIEKTPIALQKRSQNFLALCGDSAVGNACRFAHNTLGDIQ